MSGYIFTPGDALQTATPQQPNGEPWTPQQRGDVWGSSPDMLHPSPTPGSTTPSPTQLLPNEAAPRIRADFSPSPVTALTDVSDDGGEDLISFSPLRPRAHFASKEPLREAALEELGASSGGTDWCRRFREALELPSDSDDELHAKCAAMSSLARDFTCQAETYARIIISERHLPLREKTIRPDESIGGFAGGQKYLCQNILFKFAVDDRGLFGGDDEPASKFAGHELRGLNWYLRYAQDLGVLVPLTCIVDFMGMRVLAKALAPVSHETLVYGSDDGGRTVRNEDAGLAAKMAKVAGRLNLAAHRCGNTELHAACDVEGHRSGDNSYWLLDTARCWPPESPNVDIYYNAPPTESSPSAQQPPRALHKLLRPELVKRNGAPLSPDAFSGFGSHNRAFHDGKCDVATRLLRQEVIPEFAQWFDTLETRDMRGIDVTVELHRRGINLRHLGLCYLHCTNTIARAELLMEMLARTFKVIIKRAFRTIREANLAAVMEPYRRAMVEHLNLWFGEGAAPEEHWQVCVLPTLTEKFPGLPDDDVAHLAACGALFRVDYMQMDVIFFRLRRYVHFDLSPAAERDLLELQDMTAKMAYDPFNFLVQLDRQSSGVEVVTYTEKLRPERAMSQPVTMTDEMAAAQSPSAADMPAADVSPAPSSASSQRNANAAAPGGSVEKRSPAARAHHTPHRARSRVFYYPEDGSAPMLLEIDAPKSPGRGSARRRTSASGLRRLYAHPRFSRAQPFQDHDVVALR
mmetsp:Transcript_40667/g.127234  ORF Transcript_40667/g.127234 Transcript_40667/m.127234 type:complete len:748 (-) Transcript_40667:432-2675(-)